MKITYHSLLTVRQLTRRSIFGESFSRCLFATDSQKVVVEQSTSATTTKTATTTTTNKRRKRHSFQNLQDVPSFQTFQQQQQVKSVYRQFLRLVHSLPPSDGSRQELLLQVRRQFRANVALTHAWDIKRALSEASKRFKEVSAMLGNIVQSEPHPTQREEENQEVETKVVPCKEKQEWPWQQQKSIPKRPSPIPRKSGS